MYQMLFWKPGLLICTDFFWPLFSFGVVNDFTIFLCIRFAISFLFHFTFHCVNHCCLVMRYNCHDGNFVCYCANRNFDYCGMIEIFQYTIIPVNCCTVIISCPNLKQIKIPYYVTVVINIFHGLQMWVLLEWWQYLRECKNLISTQFL